MIPTGKGRSCRIAKNILPQFIRHNMNNAVKKNSDGNMISNNLSENPVKPPNLFIYNIYLYIIYLYIYYIYYSLWLYMCMIYPSYCMNIICLLVANLPCSAFDSSKSGSWPYCWWNTSAPVQTLCEILPVLVNTDCFNCHDEQAMWSIVILNKWWRDHDTSLQISHYTTLCSVAYAA